MKTKNLSYYKIKADKAFSDYVRQRDADQNGNVICCTCGTRHHWKLMDNGHFMSRRYEATRFDEKNTGPQCKSCNIYNQGRQFEFSKYLDQKYGYGTSDQMLMKSKMLCKRNRYDYEMLIEHYKNLSNKRLK